MTTVTQEQERDYIAELKLVQWQISELKHELARPALKHRAWTERSLMQLRMRHKALVEQYEAHSRDTREKYLHDGETSDDYVQMSLSNLMLIFAAGASLLLATGVFIWKCL